MAAQYVNITTVMKHFLVVFAASLASLVLTRIEDIRGVNYPHEIPFLHDYTLYREHDILFTSPVLDFDPRQYMFMFFLNSRIFRGVKPIFSQTYVLVKDQISPAHLN